MKIKLATQMIMEPQNGELKEGVCFSAKTNKFYICRVTKEIEPCFNSELIHYELIEIGTNKSVQNPGQLYSVDTIIKQKSMNSTFEPDMIVVSVKEHTFTFYEYNELLKEEGRWVDQNLLLKGVLHYIEGDTLYHIGQSGHTDTCTTNKLDPRGSLRKLVSIHDGDFELYQHREFI